MIPTVGDWVLVATQKTRHLKDPIKWYARTDTRKIYYRVNDNFFRPTKDLGIMQKYWDALYQDPVTPTEKHWLDMNRFTLVRPPVPLQHEQTAGMTHDERVRYNRSMTADVQFEQIEDWLFMNLVKDSNGWTLPHDQNLLWIKVPGAGNNGFAVTLRDPSNRFIQVAQAGVNDEDNNPTTSRLEMFGRDGKRLPSGVYKISVNPTFMPGVKGAQIEVHVL